MERPTQPGRLDLHAYRWTPFVYTIDFPLDLTAATFKLQVRQYGDAAGDPLISLQNAAAPAEGMSATVVGTGDDTVSTLEIRIAEATLETLLPLSTSGLEPGENLSLVWDLPITTAELGKVRWLEGAFVLHPGVTQ